MYPLSIFGKLDLILDNVLFYSFHSLVEDSYNIGNNALRSILRTSLFFIIVPCILRLVYLLAFN